MDMAMAFPTESDEIFFSIIAQLASRHDVVNFQSCHGSRTIGSAIRPAPKPIDAMRNTPLDEADSRAFSVHEVVAILSRNSCCSEEDSSPKRRSNASRNGFAITALQICSRQEICGDHLQTIATRFIAAQY